MIQKIKSWWKKESKSSKILSTIAVMLFVFSIVIGSILGISFAASTSLSEKLLTNTLYSEEEQEFKDFNYTPNMKRDICVIDPETTEELRPRLYFDENENKVKGRCKLKPYKSYFAFEVREDDGNI